MAARRVIVKRLSSIENFGSLSVLCSDKTGTLTEGRAKVQRSCGVDGEANPAVLLHAAVNAGFETGFTNPIDVAIREAARSSEDARMRNSSHPQPLTALPQLGQPLTPHTLALTFLIRAYHSGELLVPIDARGALVRLGSHAAGVAAALETAAAALLDVHARRHADGRIILDAGPLAALEGPLLGHVLVALWSREGWPRRHMTARHYDALARLVVAAGREDEPAQAALELPAGVRARIAAGRRIELAPPVWVASPAQ